MLKIVLAVLLFSLPNLLWSAGYLGTGKITFLQNAYGGWLLKTDGTNTNPDSCSSDTVILEPGHAQYQELYSFILSAYIAGRDVRFYVNGCHSAGHMKLSFLTSNDG